MKVLLVSVNRLLSPYPVYPLGLDWVASAISARHAVRVVDLLESPDERPLGEALAAFEPELVGISLRNIDNTDAAASRGFVGELRRAVAEVRRRSRALVVVGGAGYTLFPGPLLEASGADLGLAGEGERLAGLLDALEAGRPLEGLAGVVLPGRPAAGPPPPIALEPGRRLPEGPERTAAYLRRGGMLNLQTQRGCPFRCSYCTYPLIEGRRPRRLEPAAVAREAVGLQACGARYLFIADSVFNADPGHATAVAEAFRAAGLSIPWGAFFAPLRPPDGFYDRLAACGCTHVEFGTDSLSPTMLRAYAKAFSAEDAEAAHRASVAAGLHTAHYFLLGGPGESEQSLDQSLAAAEGLERSVCFFFCGVRIYPRTEVWRAAVAEGQIAAGSELLEPIFYRPAGIGLERLAERVVERGQGRHDWVIGAGGEQTERILERMHARGRTGPLWELLIR